MIGELTMRQGRLLVIEDDGDLACVLQSLLASLGHAVVGALKQVIARPAH